MRAEIIAVGSELTAGASLDTNSQWLSRELARIGISTQVHTTVSDDLPVLAEALKTSLRRVDLIVVTGGLGPTLDDLTREALAVVADVPLEHDQASYEAIRERFDRIGRVMPSNNERQAMLPQGAQAIENARGTAPGIWMNLPGSEGRTQTIAALPGVPSEMKPMFIEKVRPMLPKSESIIREHTLHVFGMGESSVEEQLGELTKRGRVPEVGITAHEATISLRIHATGNSMEVCEDQIAVARETIRSRLGDMIYGEQEQSLHGVVVDLLQQRGESLAVVETQLSGGILTEWLAAIPNVRRVFRGGLTAISLDIGLSSANKSAEAQDDDCLPARLLAEAYRTSFKATWGLAIVGSTEDAPEFVGECSIAVVGADCVATANYRSYGDPAIDRSRSAKTALDLLRRRLLLSQ